MIRDLLDGEDSNIPIIGDIGVVGALGDLVLNGGDLIVSGIVAPLLTNFTLISGLIGQLTAVLDVPWLPLEMLSQITIYALLVIYALRLYNRFTGGLSTT